MCGYLLIICYKPSQYPVNLSNAPSRSCRGDWKVARNTCNSGMACVTRASFHSPLHCLCGCLLTICCKHHNTLVNHHNAPPRSCRGDWKVARNTRIADTPDATRASFHSPLHCMYIPPITPCKQPRCLPRRLCRQRHVDYCADGGV